MPGSDRLTDDSGFGLAEALFALALLGILGSSVAALWPRLVDHSSTGRARALAHILVADRVEQCLELGYTGLSAGVVVDDPLGDGSHSRTTTVAQAAPGLWQLDVVVESATARDSLRSFLADR